MDHEPVIIEGSESNVPKVMLVVGIVWMCLSTIPWLLVLFLTMLSVTYDDEPMLWIACALFLPAMALGGVFLAIGYAKDKKVLMALAPALPTAAVVFAWVQAASA